MLISAFWPKQVLQFVTGEESKETYTVYSAIKM